MSANNFLFWTSLALGACAMIWLWAAKILRRPPQEEGQQVVDLPTDPE
jgi:hypothetical protein